jgi:hypothetical protein
MNEQTAESHGQGRCFCCEASERMGQMFRAFGPSEEVRNHFRQSRIEFLKGIRKMVDERIEDLGRAQNKGTRVTVE